MKSNLIKISLIASVFTTMGMAYNANPPFKLSKLNPITVDGKKAYEPKEAHSLFTNYELGMHCVGFDMSYCCVIPPYNSIQAQAIKTGKGGALPKLLSPDDHVKIFAYVKDNSYSEGNKMHYWNVAKDNDGDGHFDSPNDNFANYVWSHLFIYKDLEGSMPVWPTESQRLRVGKQIPVKQDHGPSGAPMQGYMTYAGEHGGNVVMTDTLVPPVKDVKLVLTASHLWDSLGLPLTAFNDSRVKGRSIKSITPKDFQPFQYATVALYDDKGHAINNSMGKRVQYFGTNPVDIPNCGACHSREGKAARLAREEGLKQGDLEYNYWKAQPNVSEYMARLAEGSINILSIHDAHHGTTFLSDYDPKASSNRLGKVGAVNCTDCHGDNVSGNLQEPRVTATGYKTVKAKPLSEAVHGFHLAMVPMPDAAGRSQSCQSCHPTHFQNPNMNDETNPFRVTDRYGNARFAKGDIRKSGGGCYVRRDAHSNPSAKPPFFLNSYGKWQLKNVSMKDEHGRASSMRGLYCTNCHSKVAQALYAADDIKNGNLLEGKSLRNKSLSEIVAGVAGGSMKAFRAMADAKTTGKNEVLSYYIDHKSAPLVKNVGKDGKLDLKPWNHPTGGVVPYNAASAGNDWWLSASEPHCADCHMAPFAEQVTGGKYFPIDQPNKLSLYRYSKAHGNIACQTCHESTHGLYSTRFDGVAKTVDVTTHEQALQYSPDGKYAGPVTCSACHTVNAKGVPVQLEGTAYANDYWASVTLAHFMREGDQKLSVKELVAKYPYKSSQKIVKDGWK